MSRDLPATVQRAITGGYYAGLVVVVVASKLEINSDMMEAQPRQRGSRVRLLARDAGLVDVVVVDVLRSGLLLIAA